MQDVRSEVTLYEVVQVFLKETVLFVIGWQNAF